MTTALTLDKGAPAPDFSLEADSGERVSLAQLKGKQVVLYFYPKDNTPGCTTEATDFSSAIAAFKKKGAVVLGVSKDSIKSHCNFRDKHELTITLLSDPDLTAHHAYGAFGEKMMYGKKVQGVIRSTFVIGPTGTIERAFYNVRADGHAAKVFAGLSD